MEIRLKDIGQNTRLADPYTWTNPAVKLCDFKYYEYVGTYMDDSISV